MILFQLEHENRAFQDRLKTYRGTYTDKHINKISKARGVWSKIEQKVDIEIGYRVSANISKWELPERDINLLVKKLGPEDLLEPSHAGVVKTHSPSLLNTCSNPAAGISGKTLRSWMYERIELMKVRPYYLQFSQVPLSFDTTGSLGLTNIDISTSVNITE